jgi:hypothetical protein
VFEIRCCRYACQTVVGLDVSDLKSRRPMQIRIGQPICKFVWFSSETDNPSTLHPTIFVVLSLCLCCECLPLSNRPTPTCTRLFPYSGFSSAHKLSYVTPSCKFSEFCSVHPFASHHLCTSASSVQYLFLNITYTIFRELDNQIRFSSITKLYVTHSFPKDNVLERTTCAQRGRCVYTPTTQ